MRRRTPSSSLEPDREHDLAAVPLAGDGQQLERLRMPGLLLEALHQGAVAGAACQEDEETPQQTDGSEAGSGATAIVHRTAARRWRASRFSGSSVSTIW